MIDTYFPVVIYRENNLIPHSQNHQIAQHLLEIQPKIKSGGTGWIGGTYTTHHQYDLYKDDIVRPLMDQILLRVNYFAQVHSSFDEYRCDNAWFNINKKNTLQEFHSHPNSIISCAYYIAAPEGSGDIVFEDPKEPDMFPLKNVKEGNHLCFNRVFYKVEEGMLLVFRSYLRHAVVPGKNKAPRISISANFS